MKDDTRAERPKIVGLPNRNFLTTSLMAIINKITYNLGEALQTSL